MKKITLTLNMPDEVLAQMVLRAREQGVTLEEMVVELLQDTFDEPTNAEIIAGIREGMRDAMLGNTRPAHEVLDELDAEIKSPPKLKGEPGSSIIKARGFFDPEDLDEMAAAIEEDEQDQMKGYNHD